MVTVSSAHTRINQLMLGKMKEVHLTLDEQEAPKPAMVAVTVYASDSSCWTCGSGMLGLLKPVAGTHSQFIALATSTSASIGPLRSNTRPLQDL